MNRMEEYREMLKKLETVPEAAASSTERAKARLKQGRVVCRTMAALAAVFCMFIGIVNLSPSVAAACMKIPLLDKLTDAVVFSPSLQKAVEHDYVQPLGLEETQNGITVRVEHVIVDQKQVNIFYTVTSQQCDYLVARPDLLEPESGEPAKVVSVYGNERVAMGEMRHILADYGEADVPSQLRLCVDVMGVSISPGEEEPSNQQWDAAGSGEAIASFDFLMTFDPTFTETGKVVPLDKEFNLDGNRFVVSQLCIYPSHIRIQIEEDPGNTSWLQSMHFYLELEDGTVIETGGNGISALGNSDTPSMTTYMAESSYFYEADCFRLVVTGADFLEKDFGKTYVNLEKNTAENLPEGHEFVSAARVGGNWELEFLHPDDGISHVQVYGEFFDKEGNRISTDGIWWSGGDDGTIEQPVMRKSGYRLKDFSGSEVWIEPYYSRFWYPYNPVIVEIKP